MHLTTGRSESGLTLLEVLIAVLVFAFGLLGIAGLQASALGNNFVSYQYTQAAILAQSMVERMRANRQGLVETDYSLSAGISPTAQVDCSGGNCKAAADQARWDMAVWYTAVTGNAVTNVPTLTAKDSSARLSGALPGGATAISCPVVFAENEICTVSIYWDSNRNVSATSANRYNCDPDDSTALRCLRLAFTP